MRNFETITAALVGLAIAAGAVSAVEPAVTPLAGSRFMDVPTETFWRGQSPENAASWIEAEPQTRGTLLQWSYGTSFTGGPKRDEPIVTDRPDFTEAPVTVGRGVVQLETGYTYSLNRTGAVNENGHSYPETLLRVGVLADWLEFRAAYNHSTDHVLEGGPASLVRHDGDHLYLGMKLALTPQEDWLPKMAILPQMVRSSGNQGRILPGVNWLYEWEITERLVTGGSTQMNRSLDAGTQRSFMEFAQSWTIGCKLAEPVTLYSEWFMFTPFGSETAATEHYINGGFMFLLTDDIQLDIRSGFGLNEAANDFFGGGGLSVRF